MKKWFMVIVAFSLPLVGMLTSCKRAVKPEPVEEDAMAWVDTLTEEELDIYYGRNQPTPEPEPERVWFPEDLLTENFWSQAYPNEVHDLVRGGADVQAKDEDGLTAMMWAAKASHDPELILALMEYDSDFLSEPNEENAIIQFVEQNELLKDSELHRNLVNWNLNNLHMKQVAPQDSAQDLDPQLDAVEPSPVE